MTAKTALPMSQQVLAWLLNGLGYSDNATTEVEVSGSTLKNAKRGEPIPRSWDGLLVGSLRLMFGSVDPDLEDALRDKLRAWDADLGTLPNLEGIPLADRLHAPLTLLLPEVGYRLGALIGLAASRSGHDIARFEWIAEPFSERFLGSVVRWLFRLWRPDLSSQAKRRAALEEVHAVDWRTIERWSGGKSTVPNGTQLANLGALLGDGAEGMLRAARLACTVGRDLRRWLGPQRFDEWAALVRYVALFTAQVLWTDDGSSGILSRSAMRLAESGDALLMSIASRTWPSPHLTKDALVLILQTAAQTQWIERRKCAATTACLVRCILEPTEDFAAAMAEGLEIQLLHEYSMGGWVKFIGQRWRTLALIGRLAAGNDVTLEGVTVVATTERQRAARTMLLDYRTFAPSGVGEPFSLSRMALAAQLLGGDMLAAMLALPVEQMAGMINPNIEKGLDDVAVARSRTLAMRRSRRLAAEGDIQAATEWMRRAVDAPACARSESEDLLATIATQAAYGLDVIRPLRTHLRRCRPTAHAEERRVVDEQFVPMIRLAIDAMLALRTEPTSLESTLVLASVVPLSLRLERLERELHPSAVPVHDPHALVKQLELCVRDNPLVGSAWVALAVWYRLRNEQAAAGAERQARHFGHGDLLDATWLAISIDLSDDVG